MSTITIRIGMGPASHHAIARHKSTIQQGIEYFLNSDREANQNAYCLARFGEAIDFACTQGKTVNWRKQAWVLKKSVIGMYSWLRLSLPSSFSTHLS